ncbi:MAG: hypothetical protein WBV94_04290 [Blastocatellia bacterium]
MKKVACIRFACIRFLSFTVAAVVLCASAFAQTSSPALSNLPESDAIAYINLRRILSDVLPHVMTEKQLAEMKAEMDKLRQSTGIDPYGIENAVLTMRLGKSATGAPAPEFLLVVRGSFNADALLALMRIGLKGKYKEEKYGSKTLTTLNLSETLMPGGDKEIFSLPVKLSEVSVGALDSGTIALGSLDYLKAGIDAQKGEKVIKPELTALASRDPNSLFSIAGIIPPGLLGNLLPKEMGGNDELNKLIAGIDQIYLSIGLDTTDYTLLLTIRTGSAEHANTLMGLAQMGVQSIGSSSKDKPLKELLKGLEITTQDAEVQLRTRVPQTVVTELARSMAATTKQATAAAPSTPAKATTKKPTQRRATGKRPVKKP